MAPFWNEFQHLEIQLQDIKLATNNFDEKKVIGSGGFGKVYRGEISLSMGRRMVAFKRLDRKFGQGDLEFWKEIMMLSRYTHENLISLLGFCKEEDEMIIVYEYAARGSLDRYLKDANLPWKQRLKICLDAARGLSYLHDDKGTRQRVLHRDIKSSNILVDENWNAKVSDMGLSKIGPANQQYSAFVTNVVGTPGYCDPVYMETYSLTKESDVYSFGVVLFEVLCGRLCYANSNGRFHIAVFDWKKCYEEKKLYDIIFQNLKEQMNSSSLEMFSDIAYRCLHKSRQERPTMTCVAEKLEIALKIQESSEGEVSPQINHQALFIRASLFLQDLGARGVAALHGLAAFLGPLLENGFPPFIVTPLLKLVEIRAQGHPHFPFKTHHKSVLAALICVVIYFAYAAGDFATLVHQPPLLKGVAHTGRILCLFFIDIMAAVIRVVMFGFAFAARNGRILSLFLFIIILAYLSYF